MLPHQCDEALFPLHQLRQHGHLRNILLNGENILLKLEFVDLRAIIGQAFIAGHSNRYRTDHKA